MIKLQNTDVFGWESAIRGMRNPMNSWDKSDSGYYNQCDECYSLMDFHVGANDLKLMKNLCKAGSDHAKFLRMINVTLDITAPLYWWKEFDTYKVGTVANSCSTMHKIHAKEFTVDDFSHEMLFEYGEYLSFRHCLDVVIEHLNYARNKYLETKNKDYWWQMIQLLPSSYNQRRTVQLNYQVLLNMYRARKHHKLDEWIVFCEWIESLPYFEEICLEV